MNVTTHNVRTSKRKSRLFLIFFFSLIFFNILAEFLYRDVLFEVSLKWIHVIMENSNLKEHIVWIDWICNFLGTYHSYAIMVIFVYNITNIYKTFILICSSLLSYFIGCILKLIYLQPMMFYSEKGGSPNSPQEYHIEPIICYVGWGNPALNSFACTSFYLTLWKIIFQGETLRHKTKTKIFTVITILSLILIINLCKFFGAMNSINQIIYGIIWGIIVYIFLFHVLDINMRNGKDLSKLINFNIYLHILFQALGLGLMILFYFVLQPHENDLDEYRKNIDSTLCVQVPQSLRFNDEALSSGITICCFIFMIFGMKLEYIYVFKNNELNWRQYNFDKEDSEEESLLSRLSINKETQWNHTSFFISFLRLFIVLLFSLIVLLPAYLIRWDAHVVIVFILKITLPMSLFVFGLFFLFKIMLRKFGLTNDSIFTLLGDTV
jgi:hypothetical protein